MLPRLPSTDPLVDLKNGLITKRWYTWLLNLAANPVGTEGPPKPPSGGGVDPGEVTLTGISTVTYETDPVTHQQVGRVTISMTSPASGLLSSVTVWIARPADDSDLTIGDIAEGQGGDYPVTVGASEAFSITVSVPRGQTLEAVRYFIGANSTTYQSELVREGSDPTPSTWASIAGIGELQPITGFNVGVTVKTDNSTFDKLGRYDFVFDIPTDPNFMEVWIQRRWTYPNWTEPAPPEYGGNWGTVAIARTPHSQINWWPMVAEEWHQWRCIPVDWAGKPYYSDAAIVNLHVIPGQGIKVGAGLVNTADGISATSVGDNIIRNPGFEFDKAEWVAPNAGSVFDIVSGAGQFYSGTKAALVGTPWGDIRQYVPARPNDTYWMKAYTKWKSGTTPLVCYIQFFGASGFLGQVSSVLGSTGSAVWTESTPLVGKAPANTTSAAFIVACSSAPPGEEWYVDNVTAGTMPPTGSGLTAGSSGLALNSGSEFRFNATTGALEMQNVDFTKATNFNTDEFEKTPGSLIMRIKALFAEKLKGEVVQIGGTGTKVSRFKIFGAGAFAATLLGWIGDDTVTAENPGGSGYFGAWFKRVLIGGTGPGTAKIAAGTDGSVTINDAPLTMNLNGVTARIDNGYSTGAGTYAGLSVSENTSSRQTVVGCDRFYAVDSGGVLRAYIGIDEYDGPFGLKKGGGIVLRHSDDGSSYRVAIACGAAPSSPNGVEVANGAAFIADGSPGVTGTYTFGTRTVTIKKGIITSVV